MRLLCAYGKVDLSHLRRGWLEREDWDGLYMAADAIRKAPIYIDDTAGLTPLELQARTRRLKSEVGLGLVVVDYLQLMRAGRRIDSREQEISEISRTLKALAKEHNVPVVALSQLNRDVEKRENNRPQLSDLRESGAIEQDADVIMFIYRDEVYHKNPENPRRGTAEIIVGKQRNGPTGMAMLAYLAPYTSFEDLDPSSGPQPSESLY
jgi:replicative DNA helicase